MTTEDQHRPLSAQVAACCSAATFFEERKSYTRWADWSTSAQRSYVWEDFTVVTIGSAEGAPLAAFGLLTVEDATPVWTIKSQSEWDNQEWEEVT